MQKRQFLFFSILFSLVFSALPPIHAQTTGAIKYEGNMIEALTITSRVGNNNESFRFEWLNNLVDIELFFNVSNQIYSLNDFEDDFNAVVSENLVWNEASVRFGWVIENVAVEVSNAWFKFEDTKPFDYEDIRLHPIDNPGEPTYILYEFPNNLWLNFVDLQDKGFIIGHQTNRDIEVLGFEGKSKFDLDPIVESSGLITITDYAEETPADFDEIYTEIGDESIFNKHNEKQFSSSARIRVGNDSASGLAWLIETDKQLIFNASAVTAHNQYLFEVLSYGHIRFGVLEDSNNKISSQGLNLISMNEVYSYTRFLRAYYPTSATIEVYSTSFYSPTLSVLYQHSFDIRISNYQPPIYNCNLDNTVICYGEYDIHRTNIYRGYYGLQIIYGGTFEQVNIWKQTRAIYIYGNYALTIRNAYARNNTVLVFAYLASVDSYLINVDTDAWTFTWSSSPNARVLRQYEFNLKVQNQTNPIQNANVTLYDNAGTKLFSQLTDVNGNIETKTVTRGYYTQATGNTLQDYSPHNLTIAAGGYAFYSCNFTLGEKDWVIALTAYETSDETTYLAQGILIGGVLSILLCAAFFFVWERKK